MSTMPNLNPSHSPILSFNLFSIPSRSNVELIKKPGTTDQDLLLQRGERYLMGDKLEVVWAEFSTLSLAVWPY
jgi:hypothetical protein